MKLHTGDTVLVISGKDKGKTGTVLKLFPTEHKVVIAGVNMRTKHIKKSVQQAGRILHYEASLHSSKVMLLDPKTKKPTRVGFTFDSKGHKKRIARVSGEEIKKVRAEKMPKKPKSPTIPKKEEVSSVSSVPPASSAKQPFWKRMKFGAAALEEAELPETPHSKEDHTIPSQELHVRKGARGS